MRDGSHTFRSMNIMRFLFHPCVYVCALSASRSGIKIIRVEQAWTFTTVIYGATEASVFLALPHVCLTGLKLLWMARRFTQSASHRPHPFLYIHLTTSCCSRFLIHHPEACLMWMWEGQDFRQRSPQLIPWFLHERNFFWAHSCKRSSWDLARFLSLASTCATFKDGVSALLLYSVANE